MLELVGIFVTGIVFGSVVTALICSAWAWDLGYEAGEISERQKWEGT